MRDFDDDQLVELRPVLELAGRDAALKVEGVDPVPGETPALRLRQRSRDGRLFLETSIALGAGRPTVELVTRVTNLTNEPLRGVRVGDRARWPGAHTFAPRLGFVKFSTRAAAPWIARRSRDMTYLLAFPEQPAEVAFYFDRIGPTGQIAHGRSVELSPGATHEHRRVLAVVPGGLARAAALAWPLVNKTVGKVSGVLDPAPAWATIQALHPDRKPVLSVDADATGRYELTLPEGDYKLLLTASGGEDQRDVRVTVGSKPVDGKLLVPQAGQLRYTVTSPDETPLPARLIFKGVGDTKNPNFGPIETAEGALNVVIRAPARAAWSFRPGAIE